jgi:hypothetical protein
MESAYKTPHFDLHITSLADFIAFVQVIRGEVIDDDTLLKLSRTLDKSNSRLSEAINSQKEK